MLAEIHKGLSDYIRHRCIVFCNAKVIYLTKRYIHNGLQSSHND